MASALRTLRFRWKASHAEGIIVEAKQGEWKRATLERHRAEGRKVFEVKRHDDRPCDAHKTTELIWTLIIEFEDSAGNKRQVTTQAGTRKKPYGGGERVPIWYDADQPSAIRLDSFKEQWGATILMGLLGAVMVAFGLLLASGTVTLK